ncbi:hypothetical protein CCYA_CCYA01G0240 [Cyanidiococcus yangmingshanensis]|nr:hypothetical protein CCYA_CCYA01G0240 [Cyanidiococcus yangmingshanensis]
MNRLWRGWSVQRIVDGCFREKPSAIRVRRQLGFGAAVANRAGLCSGPRPGLSFSGPGWLVGRDAPQKIFWLSIVAGICSFSLLRSLPIGENASQSAGLATAIATPTALPEADNLTTRDKNASMSPKVCTKRLGELVSAFQGPDRDAAQNAASELARYAAQAGTILELVECGIGEAVVRCLERPDADANLRTTALEILMEVSRNKQAHERLKETPLLRSLLICLDRDAGVAPRCGGLTSGFFYLFNRQRKPVEWTHLNLPLIQHIARIVSNFALSDAIWDTASAPEETRLMKTLRCAFLSTREAKQTQTASQAMQAPILETERALLLCMANLSRLDIFANAKRNFVPELLEALDSKDPSITQYALAGLKSVAAHVAMRPLLTSEDALRCLRQAIARDDDPGLRTMAIRIIIEMASTKLGGTTPAIDLRAASRLEKCRVPETLLEVLRENLSGRNDPVSEREAVQTELPQRAACRAIAILCSTPGAAGEQLSRSFLLHGADRELLRIAETFEGIDRFRPPQLAVGAAALDAFAALVQAARTHIQLIARDASFLVRRLAECVPDSDSASRIPTPACHSLLRLIGQLSEDSDILYLLANQGLCQALYSILQGKLSLSSSEAQMLVHTVANLSRIDTAKLDLLGSRGALRLLMRLPLFWAQSPASRPQAHFIGNNEALRRELARAIFNVSTAGLSRVMAAQAGGVEAAVYLASDSDTVVRRYGIRALSLFAEQIENSIRIAQANGVPVLASAVANRRTDPETARAALLALAELTNNVDLHAQLLTLGAGSYFAQYATQSVDIESQQYALAALCNLSATPAGRTTLQNLGVHRLLSGLALSAAVPAELAMLANMVVANILRNEQNVMQTVPFSVPPPE